MINVPISVSVQDAVPVHVFPSGTPFSLDGTVRYDIEQNLANSEQEQARDNISAAEVITDTASGDIVNVPDGAGGMSVRGLIVDVDPVQDLHGHSNPWPAGGGKNLANYNTDYVPTVGVNNGIVSLFAFTLPAGTYTFSCKQSVTVPTSTRNTLVVTVGSGSYQYENTGGNYNPTNLRHEKTFTVTEESNCVFWIWSNTPSVAATYSEWQVEESSAFTGYAPYSNECPISGRTGLTAYRTGKNLLSPKFTDYSVSRSSAYRCLNGVVPKGEIARFTLSDRDTTVNLNGTYVGFVADDLSDVDAPTNWRWIINNGTVQSNMSNVLNQSPTVYCENVFIYPKDEETFNKIFARYNVMVELGSTASTFEPYAGTTYPVTWQTVAGTVYGGTLDLVSGVLTVTMAEVDLGTLSWDIYNGQFYAQLVDAKIPSYTKIANAICSWFKPVRFALLSSNDNAFAINTGQSRVNIVASAYSTPAEFKTAMSGVQLCYELATPQTYQLTPTEVEMLLGENNIFSDGGSVTLEYPCDTKLFIEKLTKPTEDDMVANANIANDTYFMVGNNLYLSTAAIAAGNTIQVGVNCVSVSLPDALNALKS